MEKKINYLARSFTDIKSELINFSKKYYPEISDNFNDASVGSWFIDLVSAVGDNLSYHADRMYQENDINSANLKKTILNNARLNGIRIPGPKASMCEVELSCTLPLSDNNISQPDWRVAPTVKMGSTVGNNKYQFELAEDVNFREQFNMDGISNRKFKPLRNNNGIITAYTVTKSAIVIGGKNKIYKKVLTEEDVKPFMEVILPEKNIMNIESVIFKESANFNADPQSYEYFIDKEQYKFNGQDIDTFRFFEVDSLSDQFIFGTNVSGNTELLNPDTMKNLSYVDETESTLKAAPSIDEAEEGVFYIKDKKVVAKVNGAYTEVNNYFSNRTTRYFKGKWIPITQKFVTEYTDNGYLKLIFGSGTSLELIEDDNNRNYTEYGKYMMTKILNNDLLGVLPKIGWTMFILYRTGGGIETNLAQGSINSILNADLSFIENVNSANMQKVKQEILSSLKVTNITPSLGGKDFLSTEELKNYVKYAIQEQKRCITLGDYKSRLLMMPPKYGCPYRCNTIEDNNKIVISCLGLKNNGKLTTVLSDALVENMIEYLSHFKTLGDYIEFKSGKVYNLGFELDVFIDKHYTTSEVVKNIINKITDYMAVNKRDMGEDIFIGDLEKEINLIDGVISLIDLRVYSKYGVGEYSDTPCPLPRATTAVCKDGVTTNVIVDESTTSAKQFQIDLSQTDSVLFSDYDSMYEILNPYEDIKIKTKIK